MKNTITHSPKTPIRVGRVSPVPNKGTPGSLLLRTRELLQSSTLTLPEIHVQSGIEFYWLKKFSCYDTPDPSVNRVQKLYEFLSGQKLLP